VVDEVLLDVAHHVQGEFGGEDAGVLGLVFLEDVRLHGAAYLLERVLADAFVGLAVHHFLAAHPEQPQAEAAVAFRQLALVGGAVALGDLLFHPFPLAGLAQVSFHLLVDGGVHEEGQDGGRRAVDGHGDGGGRVAQVEAGVEFFMSSTLAMETPLLPTLP